MLLRCPGTFRQPKDATFRIVLEKSETSLSDAWITYVTLMHVRHHRRGWVSVAGRRSLVHLH
jgi:hypothetical protein